MDDLALGVFTKRAGSIHLAIDGHGEQKRFCKLNTCLGSYSISLYLSNTT